MKALVINNHGVAVSANEVSGFHSELIGVWNEANNCFNTSLKPHLYVCELETNQDQITSDGCLTM